MSDNILSSEALYAGMCRYIGTPTEVKIRSEVNDMVEMIEKPLQIQKGYRMVTTMTYGERSGFNIFCDIDMIRWFISHKVIIDISQARFYDLTKHSIILMDHTDTPPGFARLQLFSSPRDIIITSAIVPFKDGLYISNLNFSQLIHHGLDKRSCLNCQSGVVDLTFAFYSNFFFGSPLTRSLKKRCALNNWPPNHVLEDLLKHGCHFVPIGSKLTTNENDLEWRLSFYQAEQKLMKSMNHTQILCYGLLKVFLKDVVNLNIKNPFLCSYFIKTTMFWLIQLGHISWCPSNFLDCIWNCLKHLIQCVYKGVLPNFFVPEYNMFASRMATSKGAYARESLLKQLNGYYEIGVSCFLLSPTLNSLIFSFCRNPSAQNDSFLKRDECICINLFYFFLPSADITTCCNYLTSILNLSRLLLTEVQALTLQKCTTDVLIQLAWNLLNSRSNCTNKKFYKQNRLAFYMLRLAGRVGNVSSLLHLSMYFYRTCRYRETLEVIALVKSKLKNPIFMSCGSFFDNEKNNALKADCSLSNGMKIAWADSIYLRTVMYYIQELFLEQKSGAELGIDDFLVPPAVLSNMLSVLCNYRLGNQSQYLQSLTDLQTLLHFEYIPFHLRDLSWQILGICQHVVGDLQGALRSFEQSLSEKTFHGIRIATFYRIAFVINDSMHKTCIMNVV